MEQAIKPKNLLMIVDDEGLITKVLRTAQLSNRKIMLTPMKIERIINKIIAYEYLVNDFILDENSVELIKQDVDGVWCSYTSKDKKQYAKVWFNSCNPNLRKIFFSGGKNNGK